VSRDSATTVATEPAPRAHSEPLIQIEGLVKHFAIRTGILQRQTGAVQAVDGVDLTLNSHETLGLVGESGCGKSTLARLILRLEKASAGRVLFRGVNIYDMSGRELLDFRRQVQVIFQDPYSSLNPRMTVEQIVGEGWRVHRSVAPRNQWKARVKDLLEQVGLDPQYSSRYPHEFSGGQRQRIGIARALALKPQVIVCDEPVSALDVSIQAQVVNLLRQLQRDLGLAYIFIAHDLSVVRHISDRVAVMYLGKVVEIGNEEEIYERPTHPYTQALLSAIPDADPRRHGQRVRILLQGDLPSPANPPSGCRFRTRCWKEQPLCVEEVPALIDRFGHGHPSACHFAEMKPLVEGR
jgi:oligopeptide/dipeptide ABC transporter ATP-binding protein